MDRTHLIQLLTPPPTDNSQGGYIVKQLHYILLFGILGTALYTLVTILLGYSNGSQTLMSMGICALELLLFGLLRMKQERIVAMCLLLAAYVGIVVTLYFNGGLQNTVVFTTPLLLILASVFLGGDETIVSGALLLLSFAMLFGAEHLSILPDRPINPTSINTLMIIAVTIVLITVYLRLTFHQIRYNTKHMEQQARNLELSNELSLKMRSSLEIRTHELSTLNQNLQSAQRQLVEAEKMAALGSLVAGVAHEINTPLGVGVTAATTLAVETEQIHQEYEDGSLKRSALEEYLNIAAQSSQMISTNLQRAAELIQSFKQVAVDQTSMEQRIFSVKKYLAEVVRSLAPMLKRHNHTIEVTGDDAIRINSFPGDLAQIITNLVMNSITHAYKKGESGHLRLSFEADKERLRIEYQDDGCGIPEENLSKIFEPFYTTARNRGGTGLGLHIVYNLVTQKMLGSIRCESAVGQGARFIIKLPLALDDKDAMLETTEFEAMIKGVV